MESKPFVDFETFSKSDIRIGTIRVVEPVEGSEKLLRCMIDFGPELKTHDVELADGTVVGLRQILSGIRPYFPEFETLIGKQALYIVNLPPRSMMGFESHGMLLAVGDNDCVLLQPHKEVAPGSAIH